MVQGPGLAGERRQPWSTWWTPLELARQWAGYSREAGLEAVAVISRTGDLLAAVEQPANRLAQVVVEQLEGRDEAVRERLARWLTKKAGVDIRA